MKSKKLKLIQEYWDEEKTKLYRQYYVDQKWKRQGEFKSWYENGQLEFHFTYKDNSWFGNYQRWNEDGTIAFVDTNHQKKGIHGTEMRFDYWSVDGIEKR